MHPALSLAIAVGEFASNNHGGTLDAGGFTRERVSHIHLPTARFGPALVHPQEHVRPVTGLGAARTGVDAHDAISTVVRAIEENSKLERIEFLEVAGNVAFEFLLDIELGRFRLRFAELNHDPEVVELLLGLQQGFDAVAERIGFVDELLCLLTVIPEMINRHQGVEFAQTFLSAGNVKETSANGPVYRPRWSARL